MEFLAYPHVAWTGEKTRESRQDGEGTASPSQLGRTSIPEFSAGWVAARQR